MQEKRKKSQVSIFILIAVSIIAILVLYFSIRSNNQSSTQPDEIKSIISQVQECVDNTAIKAVNDIASQGGYYLLPKNSLDNNIPIYWEEGAISIPSKEELENNLALYTEDMLYFCVADIFKNKSYTIKEGKIQAKVELEDEKALFKITYPLSITKDGKTYSLEKFETEIPTRLRIIHSTIQNILTEDFQGQDICLSCIHEKLLEKHLFLNILKYQDAFVFIIIDSSQTQNEEKLNYYFAVKYG